ncbi:MAG TPA: adenylate/guanylate cyclase domain-containing protein [Terriglobales bacterium]|nr:adenylate/guanylate cyclase domain-containing protein [Terriglobales bacterium]
MPLEELRPRLVAILAADAAGYSRLMAADARGTLAALDAARGVFRGAIESAGGRVVDMAGDSVLAVFDSAAAAAAAAVAVQAALAVDGALPSAGESLRFRVGIHLGDVMEKLDGTVYGDGVNVAARVQTLAEPGGIAVSDAVRGAVRGQPHLAFEDQGPQQVKNAAEPIRVYRVVTAAVGAAPLPPTQAAGPALPDKPSLAVLPFANLGNDPAQDYFADEMAEDIITELSRFQRLFVIARNTTFAYKGQAVDVRRIGRELGVHFVLEGSVRRAGDRVRVTAQLVDAATGRQVWGERYEDLLTDVFELQERLTRQVVGSMVSELEEEHMRLAALGQRRFTNADELAWRARKALSDAQFTAMPTLADEAMRLAESAVARDDACRVGWSVVAITQVYRVLMAWVPDRRAALDSAERAADRLMVIAPGDHMSYFVRGITAHLAGNFAAGLADLRRAYELNPNDASVLFFLSWTEAAAGNVEYARSHAAQGLRVSPKDRWIGVAHLAYAMCAFIERDFPALRRWAELAIQSHPTAPIRRVLMMVYAVEVAEAALLKEHHDKLRGVAPDFIPSLFRGETRPFERPEHMAMLLDSLQRAHG